MTGNSALRGPETFAGRVSRMALFAALAFFACRTWQFRLWPPLGTDSLIYHLSLPAHWIRSGFLAPMDLPFHDGAAQHAPMFSQTILWLSMLIAGDGGLARFMQPAFMLLILWVFFRSARLAGLGRGAALPLVGLVALFPPFVNSSTMANNDLVLVTGFSLAALGMLETRRRPGPGLAIGAAGIALMTACKVVGVIHAAVALPLLLAIFAWRARETKPGAARRRLWAWGAGAAGLLLAGSFFLLRNWAIHGNPFYPAALHLFGAEIFPGLYDYSILAQGWPSLQTIKNVLLEDAHVFGPKWRFGIMFWAGFAFNLAWLFARRGRHRRRWPLLAAGVVFPLAAIPLYMKVVPFREHHRLIFPVYYALFLGLAGALAEITRIKKPLAGRAVRGALLVLVGYNLFMVGAFGVPGFRGVALLAAILALLGRPPRRIGRWLPAAAGAILIIIAATGPSWYPDFRLRREAERHKVYSGLSDYGGEPRAWVLLDKLSEKEGPLTVAYAGTPHVYPLFGPRLGNKPVYIPVSPDDRPRPTQLYHGQGVHLHLAAARRGRFDEAYWLAGLRERGVDVLILVTEKRIGGGAVAEIKALERNMQAFELIFAEKGVYVFRFLGG